MSDIRKKFTENAEQFDALMVEMLTENETLKTEKAALEQALDGLIYLHNCEMEGIESGKPSPEKWTAAILAAEQVIATLEA